MVHQEMSLLRGKVAIGTFLQTPGCVNVQADWDGMVKHFHTESLAEQENIMI